MRVCERIKFVHLSAELRIELQFEHTLKRLNKFRFPVVNVNNK